MLPSYCLVGIPGPQDEGTWDLHKLGGPCIHHGQRPKVSPGPSTCPSEAATIPGGCGPVLAHKMGWGKRNNQAVFGSKQSPLRILVTQLPVQRCPPPPPPQRHASHKTNTVIQDQFLGLPLLPDKQWDENSCSLISRGTDPEKGVTFLNSSSSQFVHL